MMWKIFWLSGASPSATKPSDSGVGWLVSNTLGRSGDGRGAWGPGTWTNCSWLSNVNDSLWRAVDQDSDVIDILVQPRRDQRAAERFFRKLLKDQEGNPGDWSPIS
jgi:DDE domain